MVSFFLFLKGEEGIGVLIGVGVERCPLPIYLGVRGGGEYVIGFREAVFLSPLHAKISWEHDALLVRDLGSRNGTWVFLRSEEHTSELQSQSNLVCRLLLEKKKKQHILVFPIHGQPIYPNPTQHHRAICS